MLTTSGAHVYRILRSLDKYIQRYKCACFRSINTTSARIMLLFRQEFTDQRILFSIFFVPDCIGRGRAAIIFSVGRARCDVLDTRWHPSNVKINILLVLWHYLHCRNYSVLYFFSPDTDTRRINYFDVYDRIYVK